MTVRFPAVTLALLTAYPGTPLMATTTPPRVVETTVVPTRENAPRQTSPLPNLNRLFNLAAQRFWRVEPQFNYSGNFIERLPILLLISAKRPQYRLAADTAEAFLRVQARSGATNWQTPTMLYLAAAAESSLGNDSEALALIDRLLTQFPNYRRPRMVGFHALDRPTAGELNRLALFHTLRLIAPSPPQTLQTAAATPTNATGKPSPYLAALLKSQTPLQLLAGFAHRGSIALHTEAQLSIRTDPNAVDMEHGYPTPCQLRAAASPGVGEMVAQLHEALLPLALKTNGAKAVRDYLRTLTVGTQPVDHPFSGYAWMKLQSIDGDILAGYQRSAEAAISGRRWAEARSWLQKIVAEYAGLFAANKATERLTFVTLSQYQDEARTALAQFRFADARALYKRIMAEFPDTVAASQAGADLVKMLPVALKTLNDVADNAFDMRNFQPQIKAYENYKAALEFTDDPIMQGYLHFRIADAAGTMKKYQDGIDHLNKAIELWNSVPTSALPPKPPNLNKGRRPVGAKSHYYIEEATYFLGYYYGVGLLQRDRGIALQKAFADKYPDSMWCQEALWDVVLWYRWSNRDRQSAEACRVLAKRCPKSIRTENALGLLITEYKGY